MILHKTKKQSKQLSFSDLHSGNKSLLPGNKSLLPAAAINTPPIGGEYIIAGGTALVYCRFAELPRLMARSVELGYNVDGMIVADQGYKLRVRELQGKIAFAKPQELV
jgi:hypothetical protein